MNGDDTMTGTPAGARTNTATGTGASTATATATGTRTRRRAAATALVLALAATAVGPAAAAADGGAPSPVGIWQLDGYGTVLQVESGRLRQYQLTGISCLPGGIARRVPGDAGFRYAAEDGDVFTVRPGSVHVDGSVGDRSARPLAALPDLCRTAPATDPVTTFDVFWRSFSENYPFFAAKGIDWNAVRDRYRPRVHMGTTDAELFAVFAEMLTPLHDAHVQLRTGSRTFGEVRPGTVVPGPDLDARVKAYVQDVDLGGRAPQEFAQGRISYADLPDGRGYLRLSGFSGFTESGDYVSESAELERALDSVFTAERPPACGVWSSTCGSTAAATTRWAFGWPAGSRTGRTSPTPSASATTRPTRPASPGRNPCTSSPRGPRATPARSPC